MPKNKHSDGSDRELIESIKRLTKTLESLPTDYDHVFHPGKHLFYTFFKAIVYGLGLLAAAAIVVPFMLAMLRGIEWVPLIGDFVTDIANRVEEAR